MKLLRFSIGNYKSFYTKQTVVFNTKSGNVDAFFGPNGGGKSNLFEAMEFFKDFIQSSSSYKSNRLHAKCFAFRVGADTKPTEFEADIQTTQAVYRYYFALKEGLVVDESLKKQMGEKQTFKTIFSRPSVGKNTYEEYGFDSALLRATRNNTLLLTKAYENNIPEARDIFNWLEHFQFVDGDQPTNETARRIMNNPSFKLKVLDLLKRADLFIQDIVVSESNVPDGVLNSLFINGGTLELSHTTYNISTTHLVYDDKNKLIETKQMPMNSTESQGTMRIFELAYPILNALDEGGILYIDEFEHHLHPDECEFLVGLFNSVDNKAGAHLMLNSHNIQIMNQIGRDNIHLVGKTSQEESVVESIPKTVRIDDLALERKYTKGLFGAKPNIKW